MLAQFANGDAMTKHFEGFEEYPYDDTQGIPTIGYGFNMDANKGVLPEGVYAGGPLPRSTADELFKPLYEQARQRAMAYTGPGYAGLNDLQQNIITDMSYNLGNRLYGFKKMREALQARDFAGVRREMQDSKWYTQTGRRGRHHVREF